MNVRRIYFALFIAFSFFLTPFVRADNVTTGVKIVDVPNAPSNFTANPDSPTQVTLTWTDNSNNLEDGFSVERKAGVSGAYAVIGTTGSGIANYTDNTAQPGTTYFYRARAFIGSAYSPYGNEASVTTPTASTPPSNPGSSGGGGGGGGGPSSVATNDTVTISGAAYPLSKVTILENSIQVLQTIAGPDGLFTGSINNSNPGNYNFYVYATDSQGRRSTPFTFPVTITDGVSTNISGVFLSPTLSVDKQEVKKGDPIIIFGETTPKVVVMIQVDSAVPIFVNTTSTASGTYTYYLDSTQLEIGSHIAKSESQNAGMISNYSIAQQFTVGDQNIAATAPTSCPTKGDFNGDCRVNLIDFSILAYWYGKPTAPAIYLLDSTPAVDLRDFSIMAYYWTG